MNSWTELRRLIDDVDSCPDLEQIYSDDEGGLEAEEMLEDWEDWGEGERILTHSQSRQRRKPPTPLLSILECSRRTALGASSLISSSLILGIYATCLDTNAGFINFIGN